MSDEMSLFFIAVEPAFWALNLALLFLAIILKRMKAASWAWAIFGLILIVCAAISVKVSDRSNVANLPFSIILVTTTWGTLGARFLGNWLTENSSGET